MNQIKLLELIEDVLGSKGKKQIKGGYTFYCPACNHHKKKLSVNIGDIDFGKWRCWVCSETNNTKGRSLYKLFRRFGASDRQISELKELTKDVKSEKFTTQKSNKEILNLPDEYIPLWSDIKSIIKKHAIVYLRKRNIGWTEIYRYSIGYAESGRYNNRIILPSFDKNGRLNYFTGRAIFDNNYKYMNPSYTKNIIPFDLLTNWRMPIKLTEGIMDAIAIRNNAIPLFGKTISDKLYEKILKERPPVVYICLDDDAKKDAVVMVEKLIFQGIKTYMVDLSEGDPSDLGFDKVTKKIQEAREINTSNFMKLKIETGLK